MSWFRQDSDKQTGMVDDFEDFFKGKSRCSWNTCETKTSTTFPEFPSEHAYVDWGPDYMANIMGDKLLLNFGAKFQR